MEGSDRLLTPILSRKRNDASLSSTNVVVFAPESSSVSIMDMKNDIAMNERSGRSSAQRRRSVMNLWMAAVSRRLGQRRHMYQRLNVLTHAMCFLGLLGVALMILISELSFTDLGVDGRVAIWILQFILTLTTVILVGFVLHYHRLNLILHCVDKSMNHWRLGLTKIRFSLILLEIFICAIHPFPRSFPVYSPSQHANETMTQSSTPVSTTLFSVSDNVALGLPMFARIYLLCRLVMFRSHLFQNTSSQSLGCLNQVSMNFFFLMKTYLDRWPTRCLFTFCVCLFFIGSWSLRACNVTANAEHASMLDSMWLFIVTFTTVGYGDLTPSTYCGRGVAAMTGLIGVFSTALLISVLAQKLQLTRAEKYVHHFDLNIQLANERRCEAANIIKFAVKLWYLKRRHRRTSRHCLQAERKLFRSIHTNQHLERVQRKLTDNCIGLPELLNLQRDVSMRTDESTDCMLEMKLKIKDVDEKLLRIDQAVIDIQKTLSLLLNRTAQ